MKHIITSIALQVVAIFTFMYDPSALNMGGSIHPLPNWLVGIATIFGNVMWIWGLLLMLLACIFTISSFVDDGAAVVQASHDSANETTITPSTQWLATLLLYTSGIVGIIGLGSGFWFTGIWWLIALVAMTKYRREFWKQVHLNHNNLKDNEEHPLK